MTDILVDQFTGFCAKNLSCVNCDTFPEYNSLSLCIIDCVYSLRARYFDTTVPVVKRYVNRYMHGDINSSPDTLTDFINNIDAAGGSLQFSETVLKNKQNLSRRNKSEICYELATKLKDYLEIQTIEDFRHYTKPELLEMVIRSVKGMGDAGTNYLYMLAGDPDRCKPNVHIHRCIVDACGCDVTNSECQELFIRATNNLQSTYPNLTVRKLDNIIWNKYQVSAK